MAKRLGKDIPIYEEEIDTYVDPVLMAAAKKSLDIATELYRAMKDKGLEKEDLERMSTLPLITISNILKAGDQQTEDNLVELDFILDTTTAIYRAEE